MTLKNILPAIVSNWTASKFAKDSLALEFETAGETALIVTGAVGTLTAATAGLTLCGTAGTDGAVDVPAKKFCWLLSCPKPDRVEKSSLGNDPVLELEENGSTTGGGRTMPLRPLLATLPLSLGRAFALKS